MQSNAKTPEEYIAELPDDRQDAVAKLRRAIKKRLPKGFEETMGYGMMGWVVPHKLYPAGYHCDPKQPLPFMGMASQKNYISFYHMGLYGEGELLEWFQKEFAKASPKKLNMGKCCVRFRKAEDIPYDLMGELAGKMTPAQWIEVYESVIKGSRKRPRKEGNGGKTGKSSGR